MLRKCTEKEFDEYMEFVYLIAKQPEKSGYPSYFDGVKTKEMFLKRSRKAYERDTENILLYIQEGKVEGWIHYYWIPEDKYLSTCSFNINSGTEIALQEFISFAQKEFKGYSLYLGYPADNKCAIDYLCGQGWECIEKDYNNIAYLNKIEIGFTGREVVRITKDNYELFRYLHSQIVGEMYWNSDRILADLENWCVFVIENDNGPAGAVYYMDEEDGWFEIFGIDLKDDKYDAAIFRELLIAAIVDIKNRGGKYLSFFAEEKCQTETINAGFECIGQYECYFTKL